MSRAVDVIIPIYGNFDDSERAIDAALGARNLTPSNVIVIDDASPQANADSFFAGVAARHGVTLIRNSSNLGFVATVNLGMRLHRDRDVVLLNSDTLVFDGWLDRLTQVFIDNPRAATATPMSNAATILSYPRWLVDNSEPLEIDWRELDSLCAELAAPPQPVPTGVGFCMLIRRDALDDVGDFDAETFGQGYGEENDFCLRASRAGWINFAALNVFVWHRGGASFGAARAARCAHAQQLIEARHPGYAATIKNYIASAPMSDAWAALDALRVRRSNNQKRLVLGAVPEQPDSDWLTLTLAPNGFWRRRWQVTAPALGLLPNLPTVDSETPIVALQSLLAQLGITEVAISRTGLRSRAMARKLASAAATLSLSIRHA